MARQTTKMEFVPMTTINKFASRKEAACSDWVATEKIHGSNFQFFTNDGENIHLSSRRVLLDVNGTFLKCNLKEFLQRHIEYVKLMYQAVNSDRWQHYRTLTDMVLDDDDEEVDKDAVENQTESEHNLEGKQTFISDTVKNETLANENIQQTESEKKEAKHFELRIYGELYGGGGINNNLKSAVQKEIIYADEFRFYVFGININYKWLIVTEMNDLCQTAGFPYYALPICPPKPTLEELKQFLVTTGIMNSKSRLTEKSGDDKTMIEGVVMTPLKRADFCFHAVKLLSDAFTDVRTSGRGNNQKANYCTKARYHSLLSKLDLSERTNADMVVDMFIADIIKEAGRSEATESKKKDWEKCVRMWLTFDGYISGGGKNRNRGNRKH